MFARVCSQLEPDPPFHYFDVYKLRIVCQSSDFDVLEF